LTDLHYLSQEDIDEGTMSWQVRMSITASEFSSEHFLEELYRGALRILHTLKFEQAVRTAFLVLKYSNVFSNELVHRN
jgi:hypothetical protein